MLLTTVLTVCVVFASLKEYKSIFSYDTKHNHIDLCKIGLVEKIGTQFVNTIG